ncbi:MAG TPA: sodium:solute symporter family protein [Terracidiphilus sp.]|nr:sodium:solute symporter family protein [Terracidiphilus sp.]
MSASATTMTIILAVVGSGTLIGLLAGRRRQMDLEQWTVAGRGFGVVLVWLLMAGEVYTTFSLLGASGWAYSRGGPTLYILAYMTLAYVISFYVLPPLWEMARAHGLQTQPDFFRECYGSTMLAALVALVGVVSLIPYLQLQLTGMGIIVEVASFGSIKPKEAMAIGSVLVAGFVFSSGMRAVAWVSVMKDTLLLGVVVTIGIVLPWHWFGGIAPMFKVLMHTHPAHLTMPGGTKTMGHAWYVSTVLLTGLGAFMWPQSFGASFTAKSAETLRCNAVLMPLYNLSLAFVLIAGFAAVLVIPGLANGDLSLLTLVSKTFPAWFLGVVGGAGALTAMVPSAILSLTAATLFAKNLYRPLFSPGMTDDQVAKLARRLAIVIMIAALGLALTSSRTIVALLLLGYTGVAQFFPGVVLGLFWRRANLRGVTCGLFAGIIAVAFLILTKRDPWLGMNAGFVALVLNSLVTVSVCFIGSRRPSTKSAAVEC